MGLDWTGYGGERGWARVFSTMRWTPCACAGDRCQNIDASSDAFSKRFSSPIAMTDLTDVTVDRRPRLPARLAERPELLRQLDRMAPVTIIRALAGHGKTTLVARWTQG